MCIITHGLILVFLNTIFTYTANRISVYHPKEEYELRILLLLTHVTTMMMKDEYCKAQIG